MDDDIAPFLPLVESMWNMVGHADYQQVLDAIDGLPITDEMKEDLKQRFPEPGCAPPVKWVDDDDEDEDFTEAYLRHPPDPGPLSQYGDHGWIEDDELDTFRENDFYKSVQGRTGIPGLEVLEDIRENTLHILGRCNNPEDWGENHQGLVYGMVQSGKTASMINLIAMGVIAGYKLFIILAGDKSSLRKQTQQRFNEAFRLVNGANQGSGMHSPTWQQDFGATGLEYTGTFRTGDMLRGRHYNTVIVMKKETHHINNLIMQLQHLKDFCDRNGMDMEEKFPTMIIDDEADYASQNTDPHGHGTTIHNDLRELRQVIPRNCYIAYTATPQACLSADPNDPIGYPKDFFWLLEPFVDDLDGQAITRSYLGAWDVFWEYDNHLLEDIGRNEWPHYEKDQEGKDLGIWYPSLDGSGGDYEEDMNLVEAQRSFLEQTRDGNRPIPPSLIQSLADFLIGCGVRWWSHWKQKDTTGNMPDLAEIQSTYPHHSAIIHLSRLVEHQLIAREITEIAWSEVTSEWDGFDIDSAPSDHLFKRRWADQEYRTSRLKQRGHMPFTEIKHFIDHAITIVEKPIRDDRSANYEIYPGNPYFYLINSDDSGMRLNYDENDPSQIQTKRAAVIVGGQILSRGLTIEGLSVSFFGRTARMPMGDTVLQMGRWFGHKKHYIDLISIYLQDGLRNLFRQIAEADRYLRIQIKDAIFRDLRPDEILVELRNSPHFRSTSPSKSVFVNTDLAGGYSGRRALLREPIFNADTIVANNERLHRFRLKYARREEEVHNRAYLFRGIPVEGVIGLLRDLRCKRDAIQDSYDDYRRYLENWLDGDNLPEIPDINIAIMKNRWRKRRRDLSISKPTTAEEARRAVTGVFGSILGGTAHGTYRGDYFLDKDEDWHSANEKPPKQREAGDDILIVFYGLQPNYLRNKLFDPDDVDEDDPQGKWRSETVHLQPGDPFYVEVPEGEEEEHSVLVFAVFTPRGGPMYNLGVNSLLDPAKIKQIGLRSLLEDEAE